MSNFRLFFRLSAVIGLSFLFLGSTAYCLVGEAWVARYNGTGSPWQDEAYFLALDANGNVYVTGASSGIGTDFDYATIKYEQKKPLKRAVE